MLFKFIFHVNYTGCKLHGSYMTGRMLRTVELVVMTVKQ